MITKNQIQDLSLLFQIDEFTIFREYLQVLFLSYVYQEKEAGEIFFKGGTALRLLFGSPRFSEDLDFSTTCSDKEIATLLEKLEGKMTKELPGIKIAPLYAGKEGIRFRMKYETDEFKYPVNIRLDFHRIVKIESTQTSTLATEFPVIIFPQIFHLTPGALLAEKIEALQGRHQGRDLFDMWFLLAKKVKLPKGYDRNEVLKKVRSFSQADLNKDLGKFLPRGQKTIIPTLKEELVNSLDREQD